MKTPALTLLIVSSTAFSFHAPAAENGESLPVVRPQVKTVAAFKNGLAFVVRAGDTPLYNGWARMDQLPPASLGALWIGTSSESGPVTDVVTYREKVIETQHVINLAEMLEANVGSRVVVTYLSKSVEGTLLAVPGERKRDENIVTPPAPLTAAWRPPAESVGAEIILLRTTNAVTGTTGLLSIPKNAVQALEILDAPNLRTRVEKELGRTKFRVAGAPARAEIVITSLQKGIVWSPSYRIHLAEENRAQIELDAVLANDQEDLNEAEVSFVVGYPNFAFANVLSPLSLQQSVTDFIQALAAGGSIAAGRFLNVMSQSVVYNAPPGPGSGYAAAGPPPGQQSENLYFYRRTGVTMKKGDRTRFSLLNTNVACEHLYQWEISDSMNIDDRGYRLNQESKPENWVWHVLRLENQSAHPWTTAPAFVVKHGLPVAQDTLNYTPPGGRSHLKLTVATDVRAEQMQTETARQQVSIAGRNFDQVTVSGQLKLTSWKDKPITLLVRKAVVGEVIESPEGKVTKVARNLTAVNSSSEIEWEFQLAAGQDRTLTYQYKVLLSR